MGDDVRITRGNVNVHRDQGRVGSFSRTLDDHRFTFQCDQQMNFKGGKKENKWMKKLPEVLSALNSEVTRLTGKKPVDAIKDQVVDP